MKLKNNLININDYVKFNLIMMKIYILFYVILNLIKKILNNINFNKLINLNVNEIEKKFINKYSKIYNLIKFDE